MPDKEMQKELESLRAEVAALSKARVKERKPSPEPEPAPPPPAAPEVSSAAAAVVDAAGVDLDDPEAVQNHMDKLLAQLEHEIRDMPTITTLGVFSLGVLFGRLLR